MKILPKISACLALALALSPACSKSDEKPSDAAKEAHSNEASGRMHAASPTSGPKSMQFDPGAFTAAPRRVRASATLEASVAQVWAYVSNHDNLVAYSGGILSHSSVDRSAAKEKNGVGTIRSCEMPDGSKFVENVVHFNAPHRFAYTLEDGNTWGLSSHLGVVSVEAAEKGSKLTFELYFNHPKADMMAQNMTGMITMKMLPHFTKKFGGSVDEG